MSSIAQYFIGSLIVSSWLMWWFTTNLQIHLVQLLHGLGYKKSDSEFWDVGTPIHLWTKADLDNWKLKSLPAWLDELTSCPGCLSMHISFWTALFLSALTVLSDKLTFFLLAWFSWPYISNFNLSILKKLNK
jgi:hypothetical protein